MRVAALVFFASCSFAYAGPWVDDRPGHGYVSLSFSDFEANEYLAGPCDTRCTGSPTTVFTGLHRDYGHRYAITVPYVTVENGESESLASDYRSRSAQLYGEVSLGKRLGFVASMPLVAGISEGGDNGARFSSTHVGDLVLGLKYQLPLPRAVKGLALGPQVYVTTPTGDVQARAPYPAAVHSFNNPDYIPLPSGNGTVDVEARVSAGYSFYPLPLFAVAEVGFHHHLDDATCSGLYNVNEPKDPLTQHVRYSDDLPWMVQVGGTLELPKPRRGFHHFTLIGYVHGTKSFENGFIDKSGDPPYLKGCGQANNTTFVSAGAQLMFFPTKHVGVTYSLEHVLAGGNIGYGFTNTFGLAVQF